MHETKGLRMQLLHGSIENPFIVQLQQLPHVRANRQTHSQMRHSKMAYASNTQSAARNGLAARLDAVLIDIRARLARRRVYKQTFAELAQLSDRELADLGLSRSEIRRVAFQAAYEV